MTSRVGRSNSINGTAMRARFTLVAAVALAVVAAPVAASETSDELTRVAERTSYAWQLPLGDPIARGFEAPSSPYGPGHRGVAFAAPPGRTVVAAADGVVHFAGDVAGTRWVSVRHADGIVTSSGPLDALTVVSGDLVSRGDQLGTVAPAASGLHWGARQFDAYIDPLSLVQAPRPALVGDGDWRASDHAVTQYESWQGTRWGGLALHPSPVADQPGFAVAPTPNHAIVIGGLATDSDSLAFDATHLGYGEESVTALSYAGREDGELGNHGDPRDPWRDQLPYAAQHTWHGVHQAAEHLGDQLRAIRAREPGRAVDLIGHSMGGIVAAYYMTTMHDPYDVTIAPIGNIVTIASPHRGSALAELGTWARSNLVVRSVVGLVMRAIRHDGVPQHELTPLSMPVLDQLTTGAPLLTALGHAWDEQVDAASAGAFAMGTRVLTVGGAADVVATPAHTAHPTAPFRAAVPSDSAVATHVVLPGGHHGVTTTEAVREVLWDFMRGNRVDAPSTVATARLTDEAGVIMRLFGRLQLSSPWSVPVRSLAGP